MKKFIFLLSFLILISLASVTANAEDTTYSWFCVHRRDHLQPIADCSFDFINKYDGYYIDKKHGNDCDEKVIYLTFDAGYENGNVEKILDILNGEGVKGAFFVLGHLINDNPELISKMFDGGHLVCNHTFSHKAMVGKSRQDFKQELESLEQACLETTGRELSKYYRPPEGRFDEDSLKYAKDMGYKTIFWSFAYADWDNSSQMSPEKAKKKILDNIHNGEIMLLHPTSETNAKILEEIIRELKQQGYRFGTLDEL